MRHFGDARWLEERPTRSALRPSQLQLRCCWSDSPPRPPRRVRFASRRTPAESSPDRRSSVDPDVWRRSGAGRSYPSGQHPARTSNFRIGAAVASVPPRPASSRSSEPSSFDRASLRIPGTVRVVVGGAGTVVSSPAGIQCGQGGPLVSCDAELGRGQEIELAARAADGSVFRKWGGACSEATSDRCRLTVAPLAEVTATFGRQSPLPGNHVLRLGETRGGFTSQPAGIDCPPACAAEFSGGTVVTLNSVTGYRLWLAECFGSGSTCAVSVDAPTRVDPAPPFPPPAPPVPVGFVDLTVSGRGVVVGSSDLRCGGRSRACSARVRSGFVDLQARPLRGARFGGWRGACGGRGLRCRLSVNTAEAKAVNAFFR